MVNKFLHFAVFFAFSGILHAQEVTDSLNEPDSLVESKVEALFQKAWGEKKKPRKAGHLNVQKDKRIDELIEGYRGQKKIYGYKVQVYSGRSRNEAIKEKSSFHSKYGDSEMTYLVYQAPNFKIRIGNFRDRLKATKALELYKIDFPSAFIVEDEISLAEN